MARIKVSKDKFIYKAHTTLTTISFIISGQVKLIYPSGELILEAGDVLGIISLKDFIHLGDYLALEDCTLEVFSLKHAEDLGRLFTDNQNLCNTFLKSAIKQITSLLDTEVFLQFECRNMFTYLQKSYEEYKGLCNKYILPIKSLPALTNLTPLLLEEDIPSWLSDYYEDTRDLLEKENQVNYSSFPRFITGFLIKASEDMLKIMKTSQAMLEYKAELASFFLNESHLDIFDLYTELLFRVMKDGTDIMPLSVTVSTILIHIEGNPSIASSLYKERVSQYKNTLTQIEQDLLNGNIKKTSHLPALHDSLDVILNYADCSEETSLSFRRAIDAYKKIQDKNTTEDSFKSLRNEICRLFYEIYTSAFQMSIGDKRIPTILKMFFSFGFVDEELAGAENAAYLYSIADSFHGNKQQNIYTIYEWLLEIFNGTKEPRRNDFDIDYPGYINELQQSGKIDKEMGKRLLDDKAQKVLFEIENMFTSANKITSGRVISFCPVFSEHCVLSDLSHCLITPEKVTDTLNLIQKYDYSAFYRDMLFYDAALPISKETVQNHILPDIILMPNVGSRGIMWQELEGKRRNSPATFVIPVFSLEDIKLMLSRITGEFRWELCRCSQGARWNDLTDPSLTSEYFDYIQFYRKNNELTIDAKEKIKSALSKTRNSYKEMFIRDYIVWILFEGNGSPRMNKVARKIFLTYCPFPKEIRETLSSHPIYKELLERQYIKRAQAEHRLKNVIQKLLNSGHAIPEELLRQKEFLEK